MRIGRGKVILGVVVVAILALIVWAMRGRAVAVDVGTVRRGPVRSFVEEEARTRCVDRYVLSSPIAGRLLRLQVLEDQTVAEGDVLARIDTLAPQAEVVRVRAALEELRPRVPAADGSRPKEPDLARAKLLVDVATEAIAVAEHERDEMVAARTKAESDRDRARRLREGGSTTPDEMETAELALTRARAVESARERVVRIRRLEAEIAALALSILSRDVGWEEDTHAARIAAAEAELRILEDDLRRCELRAPVTGRVLRRFHESETVVGAGERILEIGDVARLDVEADVLSEDAARMTVGQAVEVFGGALGDRTAEGRIKRIHRGAFKKISSLGVEQQRVTIVAEFGATEGLLGDGYRVDLRVIFDTRQNAILVPEGAVFRREGHASVFRVEGGRAGLVRVTTGLGDGREREVTDGLEAGDEVILHPANDLEDGVRVEAR